MQKILVRTSLLLLWAAMLVCTPGMSCAYTAAKGEATFSRPLHETELKAALESTPGVEFSNSSTWGRRFFFVPAGRVEFYSLSAAMLAGSVQHTQESPRVQVKFFTVNRGPTEDERRRARELLGEVFVGIERSTGIELKKRK